MVSAKTKSMALLSAGFIGGGVAALAGVPIVAPGIIGSGVIGYSWYHAEALDKADKLKRKQKKLTEVI